MTQFLKFSIFILFCITACSKEKFLSEKPDQSHIVPNTLADLQAILDQDQYMNGAAFSGVGPIPALGEIASDNYYVLDQDYIRLPEVYKNAYRWNKDIFVSGVKPIDWDLPYLSVFYANVVLDNLSKFKNDDDLYSNVKGSALFYRAHAFYNLAQIFAPPYDPRIVSSIPGIPLRLTADLNEKLERSSLSNVYQKIIDDLQEALTYLPDLPIIKTRPSKWATYGLLARIYQTMMNYKQAGVYAQKYLDISIKLTDFNDLNLSKPYPFLDLRLNNEEIAFSCNMLGIGAANYPLWHSYYALVDTVLFNEYDKYDLRKEVFFEQTARGVIFKGSFEGSDVNFAGIATDEIVFILAESLIREGNVKSGIQKLNKLLVKRYKAGFFSPFIIDNYHEALDLVLRERRKELLFRGLRWMDLRRLNVEGRNINIKRYINGVEYLLVPNSPFYTYPIPPDILSFHPEMKQNIR